MTVTLEQTPLPVPRGKARTRTAARRAEAAQLSSVRSRSLAFAALPPEPGRRIGVWHKPVNHPETHAPLLWLLGAHGGAGVSTLARQLAPAADCARMWPAVLGDESPFVVVIARETIEGLTRAHDVLRQYHCGQAGPGRAILVGLITVAAQPGRVPAPIRRYKGVIADLVPEGALLRLGWQPAWPLTSIRDLPVWQPGEEAPAKGRDPVAGVRELGDTLLATVTALIGGPTSKAKTSGAQP
ncbi:hypothetical protein [Nocardia sp. NBC_01327]|uniref:hypothetical protein n=1 Tax=Nocardia sp. NBC_01327 TaxID=2903593 RepID=UPI002E1524A8|nr:hypothetical protein OG326_42565 [Nocardia sp. NBC_01327]